MEESDKSYRLQQYIKWEGGWEVLFYLLTSSERELFFDLLKERIVEFEKGE